MPRHKWTPEETQARNLADIQETLRARIGDMTVILAEQGITDVLASSDFQPIVKAWRSALDTQPQDLTQ
jgi:ABC-type branched-subunit amino acid transport system ATPase component